MFWPRNKSRVNADAAAATPLSTSARKELLRLLALPGNPGALHQEGVAAKEALDAARTRAAQALGAHADELFFVGSGTEANNLALHKVQGHVITTKFEHPSIIEPLRHSGARITEVSSIDEIKDALTPETTLVSVQLVNSEVGTVNDVRAVAKLLRLARRATAEGKQSHKIYLHCDASQAPLWVDIKVEHLGVDMLTVDGQKIMGPKGVGALYIKRGSNIEPQVLGGGQEDGVRAGTPNVPSIGAFGVALSDAQAGAAKRAERVGEVRDYLWQVIKQALPDAELNGPDLGEGRVANNLNISIPGLDGQMATLALDARGIATSTRSACSEGDDEPSAVLLALGYSAERARQAIRITLLPNATHADARRIAAALKETAALYRK